MRYHQTDKLINKMIKKIIKWITIYILQFEARIILRKYKPKIVAVTGSVGKTGTKDMVFCVLRQHFHTRKSLKSYNSDLGVPLTIIGATTGWNNPLIWIKNIIKGAWLIIFPSTYPKWLVLEMGISHLGDMKRLARWVRPDISIITKFNKIPPHVEFFSSPEEVFNEKWELVRHTKKDGVVIYNGDDENIISFIKKTEDHETLSYGFSEDVSVRASNIHVQYKEDGECRFPVSVTCKIDFDGKFVPVTIMETIGEGYIYSVLVAISCGSKAGINAVDMGSALSSFIRPPGRLRLLHGKNNSLIIDDSYNASPDAVALALSALRDLETNGRKIAVIGDMLELGDMTTQAHQEIGEILSKDFSHVYLVGKRAAYIIDKTKGGLRQAQIHYYDTADEAGDILSKKIKPCDIILVKGSQGIRLEKVVKKILSEEEDAERVLVRQERQWEKR